MNGIPNSERTLVFGIGNNGRSDDGLGWNFLDAVSSLNGDIAFEYRYQLQVEDAELASHYGQVVFVDASVESLPKGYSFRECSNAASMSYSTHKLDPDSVMILAHNLYQAQTRGFVLAIEGHQWGLGLGLSDRSRENLNKAVSFFLTDFKLSVATNHAI